MARKRVSQFHDRIQGTAYETLKSAKAREAIEQVAAVFTGEFPNDCGKAWESLCAVRDHVNALIGAWQDVDSAHRNAILERVQQGEFKENPQGAVEVLNTNLTATVADLHAEIDRQGIPEV